MWGRLTAILLLLALAATLVYAPQSVGGHSREPSYNGGRILLNRTIRLQNSYYPVKKTILSKNTVKYYLSQIQNYTIVNMDGDKYPEILVWTLKEIYIWSWKRGVYASIHPTYMFDDPIPVDTDHDGLIDYVILLDHPFYDARYYYDTHINDIKTIVKKWDPVKNTVRILGTVKSILLSRDIAVVNDKIYIPGLINLYRIGYSKAYTSLGVAVIDTKTWMLTYKNFYAESFRVSGYIETNDITTNYEAYIYPYLQDKLIYIPMGIDKIFILSTNPLRIAKTINIPQLATPKDNVVLLPRGMPPHSPETHSMDPRWIDSSYYTYSPQTSGVFVDDSELIVPVGKCLVEPPPARIYGLHPRINDYSRFERIDGVGVIDLVKGYTRIYWFVGKNIDGYTLRAITSVKIINKTLVLIGGIAQDTKVRDPDLMARSIVVEYKYNGGEWQPVIKYIVPRMYHATRTLPVLAASDYVLTSSYIYFYDRGVEVRFHKEIYRSDAGDPLYYWNPPILRPVLYADIDGDGWMEYSTVIQYQRSSYTAWSYGYTIVGYNPPYIRYGKAWLLAFKNPLIEISVEGGGSLGSELTINITVHNTRLSVTGIKLIEGGVIKELGAINGSGRGSFKVLVDRPGEYILQLESRTRYYVNETIATSSGKQLVEYNETINITILKVKYRTRILIKTPSQPILTPNSYYPILKITAEIQKLEPGRGWIKTTPVRWVKARLLNNDAWRSIYLYLDSTTMDYIGYAYGLEPGQLNMTISYGGSRSLEPATNKTSIRLIKYPVNITVQASTDEAYALTPMGIYVEVHYYKLVGHKWYSQPLHAGSITASIKTLNGDTVSYNGITPWKWISIGKYIVLPPEIMISLHYYPPNKYYAEAEAQASMQVRKISLLINGTHTVVAGENMTLDISEVNGTSRRNVTAPVQASLVNKTYTESLEVNGDKIIIPTKGLKPGNYMVKLSVLKYRAAYIDPDPTWNLSIRPASIKVALIIKPAIEISGKNAYTYTLTPVYITSVISLEEQGEVDTVTLLLDDGRVIKTRPGTRVTVRYKYPGKHVVSAVVDYYGHEVSTASYVNVYRRPVWIGADEYNGILVVRTWSINGDPAPGGLEIILRSYNGRIFRLRTNTTGRAVISLANIPHGLYSVMIKYSGNESYMNAGNTTVLYIGPTMPPLPEPPIIPITLLAVLILYLTRNINRKSEKTDGP